MENEFKRKPGRPPASANVVPVADKQGNQTATVSLVNVRVVRDFWTDEGRVTAGTIISVPVQDALRGVKNGSLDPVED